MRGRDRGLCLVTGATGYIGGRLVPELLDAGYRVRCLARSPGRLRAQPWIGRVEVVRADVADAAAVRRALDGVRVAYYLVHALVRGRGFPEEDRRAARTFAAAVLDAGVGRIVYLGGLGPLGPDVSEHLRSRAEVGSILLASGVPTAVLRAAVVVGSGSASFEMMRYLTERLPVMVTPRWVHTRTQPIAVGDVLWYLVGCAELPSSVNRAFDIGGPDVLTYEEMMRRYAAVAGLPRRVVVPVPVLSARLSSLWVGLVTPVPGRLARPLAESQRHEVVCREHDIARFVPDPPGGLTEFDEAVRLALRCVRDVRVSRASAPGDPSPGDPAWAGGTLCADVRECPVAAPPEALWRVIEGIGGAAGWYSWSAAWAVRGGIDRLFGGVGMRRGRREPHRLRVGDAVDFWRVEEILPGKLLRLRAEMRLPGLAWLELAIEARRGRTWLRQRVLFRPRGFVGLLYWWASRPFHGVVFGGMRRGVRRAAEREAARVGGRAVRVR
ncbi:SDR family oxidoreductase [Actinoallomurus sp. NPDC050550]|uniref:SDR family oxidoreductase n=1 Tax=Actinoallomurus sp. NPDC050550 TaxID=3154937 RepID=UPI0033FB6851